MPSCLVGHPKLGTASEKKYLTLPPHATAPDLEDKLRGRCFDQEMSILTIFPLLEAQYTEQAGKSQVATESCYGHADCDSRKQGGSALQCILKDGVWPSEERR